MRRTHQIRVPVDSFERDEIVQIARRRGIPIAELVRRLVRNETNRDAVSTLPTVRA